MTANTAHYTTFVALFKLWGVRADLAEVLSEQLYLIDNDAQDNLIAFMAEGFQKSQSPQDIEQTS